MRLDHLLSKEEEVRVVLLLICQGTDQKRKTPERVQIERTLLAGQDKGAVRDDGMLTPSSREVLLYNWSLPVIRKFKSIEISDD